MKKIKFIYFDIGGVLVDHISSLKKIARELGISEKEMVILFKNHADKIDRGLLSWKNFESILRDKLNPSNKLEVSLAESFVNNFEIIKETHDLMYELENKIDIGILSNIAEDIFELVQSQNLIPNINYKAIVKSAEINLIKPEKEIFDYALKQISISPDEVLFIDDSEINVTAAKSLGWNSILFNTQKPIDSVEEIKKHLF